MRFHWLAGLTTKSFGSVGGTVGVGVTVLPVLSELNCTPFCDAWIVARLFATSPRALGLKFVTMIEVELLAPLSPVVELDWVPVLPVDDVPVSPLLVVLELELDCPLLLASEVVFSPIVPFAPLLDEDEEPLPVPLEPELLVATEVELSDEEPDELPLEDEPVELPLAADDEEFPDDDPLEPLLELPWLLPLVEELLVVLLLATDEEELLVVLVELVEFPLLDELDEELLLLDEEELLLDDEELLLLPLWATVEDDVPLLELPLPVDEVCVEATT